MIEAEDRPYQAVVLICAATFCFAIMAGCVKWLSAELPSGQVIWGRYFFHVVLIAVLFPARVPRLLASRRLDLQVIRSCLVFGATVSAFVALRYLPMADVAAIGFVGPLIVVAMARLFLGETVSARRWIAVGIGFIGVLIILRPGLGATHWATALPLLMACCYAGYQILTRRVRGLATPLSTLLYSAAVGTVISSLWAPLVWRSPEVGQWLLMAATGLFGGAGHLAIIKAYESAPASVAGPFVYSELLWAIAVGFILFDAVPDAWTLLGAAVLVITGLYLLKSAQ